MFLSFILCDAAAAQAKSSEDPKSVEKEYVCILPACQALPFLWVLMTRTERQSQVQPLALEQAEVPHPMRPVRSVSVASVICD
jgi:hypothetical protein